MAHSRHELRRVAKLAGRIADTVLPEAPDRVTTRCE
jgi:hypothetical protein